MPGLEHEAAVELLRRNPHFIDGLLDQGRAEGEARGEAKMLLRVLAARGFAVTDDVRELVAGCTDTGKLETWADRAVTASSIAEVFTD